MQNNGVAHGNIVDNDDIIIIEDNTAHNNPQEPEVLEINDDEVEVLALVKPKRNPQPIQQVSGGVRPKFAASAAQRSQVRVDLTQSDDVSGVERMETEVERDEEDSDVEEINIDTSSTESMLNFIMGTPNEPSTSDVGTRPTTFRTPVGVHQIKKRLTGNPGPSNEPSTSSGSSDPVEVPQMKMKLAGTSNAPTPAKKICLRNTETVQNERAFSKISQGNQQSPAGPSTSSASFEAIPIDAPSTSGAGPAPPAQHPPRRSTRTILVPKNSENKENVPSAPDSEPGPSSSKPAPQQQSSKVKEAEEPNEVRLATKPISIGAAILGEEDKNKIFYFPRTPAVPTGLKRTPFNGELPKDIRRKCEYSKIVRKLKIQKDVNFPKSAPEGKMIQSVLGNEEEEPAKSTYPGDTSKNDPKGAATLEKFLGDTPDQAYMNLKDKEEKVWSAEKLEEHLNGDEGRKEAFYRVIEQKYLFAVWRQFESHVPLEYALQNLQKNEYNISLALGSIDKYLKKLPQKIIAPSAAQVKYMATEFEENGEHMDLSWIQDNVMRNYHMAEIHGFHYKFMKFFESRENGNGLDQRVACNCRQQLCRPLSFEPRYGCANCTNKLRKHKLPANNLCLLCSTQMEVARRLKPAEKPTFDSDDLEKIKKWDREVPRMSRTEFEKWMQDQKNERYKKLQLTQEEVLMLDFEKLTVSNLAEQVTAQLQPYVLPHFSRCGCSRNRPVANPPPKIPEL